MPVQSIRVGSGAGFSGDRIDAAQPVIRELMTGGGPTALMFETLGERTLALAQLRRRENPELGYEPKLAAILQPILPDCLKAGITILGNFGAGNPPAAGRLIDGLMAKAGLNGRIAVITGDDLLQADGLEVLRAHCPDLPDEKLLISANAYLGAEPLAQAMAEGADIVVTGRVADPSLALAPMIHHLGWATDDWDRLAQGTMAGHLLECGAQVTGGYFADPGLKDVPNIEEATFPIATMNADGSFVIGKPPGGGLVDRRTVTEQLLYEVHDPAGYLTPDVAADITGAEIVELGGDRVRVDGIRGHARPETLKVTVCFDGGWIGEGEISYMGPNAAARARLAGEMVRRRAPQSLKLRFDLIGVMSVLADDGGAAWRDFAPDEAAARDVRLRVAMSGPDKESVERGLQEIEALYCTGPAAGGGIRLSSRRRISTISCYVPRAAARPRIEMLEARHG
ncbi:acyclic terpene utilization AtuA family protein [Oceanibaculum pacificum]|uniref:Acyclic terpene utilisation N-terminal domain-containing protein n=1 Tax=Oceanibaculum pacificum TaxID=580166 RepID=A0A154W727_9PROT|nr:acyclic terpene utilization AtuA family protein [Oceanibaculum pacificum]KZD09305.1 hypothetical protein AUP43_07500 [Oceanibaculum pacificum]